MKKICIIKHGSGNLGSLKAMLNNMSLEYFESNDLHLIKKASHVILPGVGSFKTVMQNLEKNLNIDDFKNFIVDSKTPLLGICIGMQLFATNGYEDGVTKGLGFIDGEVVSLKTFISNNLKAPHMGWNNVNIRENFKSEFSEVDGLDFYHVHNYFFNVEDESSIYGEVNYGIKIPVIIKKNNILGVQFHPEKSHSAGRKIMNYFLNQVK